LVVAVVAATVASDEATACSCTWVAPGPSCPADRYPEGCYTNPDNCSDCSQVCDRGLCEGGIQIGLGGCDSQDKLQTDATLNRVGGPGGLFWSNGNVYSARLAATGSIRGRNWGTWGDSTTFSFAPSEYGLVFTVAANADPSLRTLSVSDFAATIPSFVHPATDPAATGVNNFTLRTTTTSVGIVNTTTGEFTLTIHALLTNAYYPASSPARVSLTASGTVNPLTASMTASITGVSFDPS
jgi:hypothetical protein